MAEPAEQRGLTLVLALMTIAAGGMDALAFLRLDEVFTSAMSGNTVFFGIALGRGHMLAASHSMTAFAGYAIGVVTTSFLLERGGRARVLVLIVEMVPLAGFAALWTALGGPGRAGAIFPLIALSALAMGMQGALGRRLHIPGVMTTIITGTLTSLIGSVADRLAAGTRPTITRDTHRLVIIILTYLAGAVAVGFALSIVPALVPFFSLALIALAVAGLVTGLLEL